MIQTFDDMLENERTWTGRLQVWARTLLNLPFSAAKEHATNGKEIIMNHNMKILLIGAIVAIVGVGIGSYWFGNLHAMQGAGIERVTIAQLADAMRQDEFYSDYGNAAVLFTGEISAVKSGNNATLVTFVTNRPFSVTCQFPKNIAVKTGQTISVAAPGGSADRQKQGVLLHNCLVN